MTISATTSTVNGLIRIKGTDASKFLQGQLTCDMSKLGEKNSLPGAYCSPQGRVRATFIIFQLNIDDFLMILPKPQVSFMLDIMAPYVAFFKCTMTDSSDNWHFFGLQLITDAEQVILNDLPELTNVTWEISAANSVYCIRLPGETLRWLCLSKQPTADYISNLATLKEEEWQREDLLSGLTWISELNRDKFLPHDLSLPTIGAISFTKGCYTGQEIVARMQYRGDPKYLLAIIKTPPIDDMISEKIVQLVDNSEHLNVGTIIERLHLSDNSWLISASVKRALLNQAQFQLLSNERSILCSIRIPTAFKESNNQ